MKKVESNFLKENFNCNNRKAKVEELSSIANFSFIWNIFERKIFKKEFSTNRKNYVKIRLTTIELEKIKKFVRKRYLKYPHKKIDLFTRDDQRRNYFEKIISNIWNNEDILKWLLVWVYRLRNNYFHWEKELELEENKLFENANSFMIKCIESYQEN